MVVQCFPCSLDGCGCLVDGTFFSRLDRTPTYGQQVREALGVPAAGCQWFHVALWRNWSRWSRDLFPFEVGYVQASAAFCAIEALMRHARLWSVDYACARAVDGSLVYSAYRVWVDLRDLEADEGEPERCRK